MATELGIKGCEFTVNGAPTFLLGISYYGALGASEEIVRRDLGDMQRYGINWLRVWATWSAFGNDVSAIDADGRPREPFLGKLQWLVSECDRRGRVVDVTISRGNGATGRPRLQSQTAHRRAVETLVRVLEPRRNWYLDTANERNVADERFASIEELKEARELVRRLDPARLVTASHGDDISRDELGQYLLKAQVDFVTPHRPRHAQSPAQTAAKPRECLAWMVEIGRMLPLHYQEPFRRGYGAEEWEEGPGWEPLADDFLTDLQEAKAGGVAGWCFHNGDQRHAPEHRPRRSFDLRQASLFEQLDGEEHAFLQRAFAVLDR